MSQLPAALRRPQQKTRPGILEHVFCGVCDFKAILRSPGKQKSSYGRFDQMTMPARRASKFCANRRAAWLPIFFLSLISSVIPGKLEPLPECRLDLILDLQPTTDLSWN